MRRKRRSAEQVFSKFRDAEELLNAGKDVASVLQTLEISALRYLRWTNQYGGMKTS